MVANEKPYVRNRSRIVVVDGEWVYGPIKIEVQREEWLNRKTGRYRTIYSARMKGSLGWHTGRTIRNAIMGALCYRDNRRPRWMAKAVQDAKAKLR